jgi:GNAT superfamily N-acetyltransferase
MSVRAAAGGVAHGSKRNGGDSGRPVALTVRLATPSDLVPLTFFFDTALRKDYFLKRGQLADILKDQCHQVYVAEVDTVLVGVAVLTHGSRLVNALVHPAYRGLGIGRQLVRHSAASEVRAKIDMSTGDPREFYESLGFESTGCFNGKGNIEMMRRRGNTRHNGRNGHTGHGRQSVAGVPGTLQGK